MIFIPIDIINKILVYHAELNNYLIILQYNPINNIEFYKINRYSNFLLSLRAVIGMKIIYPLLYTGPILEENKRIIYNFNKEYYKQLLHDKIFL